MLGNVKHLCLQVNKFSRKKKMFVTNKLMEVFKGEKSCEGV